MNVFNKSAKRERIIISYYNTMVHYNDLQKNYIADKYVVRNKVETKIIFTFVESR